MGESENYLFIGNYCSLRSQSCLKHSAKWVNEVEWVSKVKVILWPWSKVTQISKLNVWLWPVYWGERFRASWPSCFWCSYVPFLNAVKAAAAEHWHPHAVFLFLFPLKPYVVTPHDEGSQHMFIWRITKIFLNFHQILPLAWPRSAVDSASRAKGPGFNTRSGHILSFLPALIQEGQLSVTGESMCMKYYWLTA